MAPKRAASPPPAASSDEIGSTSGSEESDSDSEIAHSPPPAAPQNTAPPLREGQESDTSDDDDDEEEEEEEEKEKEKEKEEEDNKANHATLSPTTKKPSPPAPKGESSESSDDDEEEPRSPTRKRSSPSVQEEAKTSLEDKKQNGFARAWSTDDEVRILETLAEYRREHGMLPQGRAVVAALADCVNRSDYHPTDLKDKIFRMKRRYKNQSKQGKQLSNEKHERRLFDLSQEIWGPVEAPTGNDGARRDFSEMCELYPYLAEEVKLLDKVHPGLLKREFSKVSDDKARRLDLKIKKQRLLQMKVEMQRHDLTKEVTKTLINLVD